MSKMEKKTDETTESGTTLGMCNEKANRTAGRRRKRIDQLSFFVSTSSVSQGIADGMVVVVVS
jgi:hypothetical protein